MTPLEQSHLVSITAVHTLDVLPSSLSSAIDRELAKPVVLLVEHVGDRQRLVRWEGRVALCWYCQHKATKGELVERVEMSMAAARGPRQSRHAEITGSRPSAAGLATAASLAHMLFLESLTDVSSGAVDDVRHRNTRVGEVSVVVLN